MSKIILMFVLSLFFFSCEKDYLIPDNEVPDWLKSKIKQDEQYMKDHPSSCLYYGGWLRYSWQDEYYFEYHCSCSSSSPVAISMKGDTLHIRANDISTDYYKEKCCKTVVWKAPKFSDIPDK